MWLVLQIFEDCGYASELALRVANHTMVLYGNCLFEFFEVQGYIYWRIALRTSSYQFPFLMTAQNRLGPVLGGDLLLNIPVGSCLRSYIYMKTHKISHYKADWFFDTRTSASLYRYTGCHEAEEIRLNLCWQCHGPFDITSKDAHVTKLLLQYRWCFFESGPWISCCLCHH